MKHYIKTVVAASAMLAMIGCAKNGPSGAEAPGPAETEWVEPDVPKNYRDVFGTVSLQYTGQAETLRIHLYDANGAWIDSVEYQYGGGVPLNYNFCEKNIPFNRPLPWTICLEFYYPVKNLWVHKCGPKIYARDFIYTNCNRVAARRDFSGNPDEWPGWGCTPNPCE
jgi:hypothetical protein